MDWIRDVTFDEDRSQTRAAMRQGQGDPTQPGDRSTPIAGHTKIAAGIRGVGSNAIGALDLLGLCVGL